MSNFNAEGIGLRVFVVDDIVATWAPRGATKGVWIRGDVGRTAL